jgi:phosphohistidine phosphatase
MELDLYLLRHGIAADKEDKAYKSDFDRPLTPEGEQKLRRITKALRALGLTFDLILSSPYVRARETAEIVAAALALRKKLSFHDSLGADANPREFIPELAALSPAPARLLLVGHEPYLSNLTSLLISGTAKSCIRLKKGGLCKLVVESTQPLRVGRCAKLDWLLTPRQMLLMA